MLSRVINSFSDSVLLSEVHPLVEALPSNERQHVKWQAKNWYGINLESHGYFNQILELEKWCNNNGKNLIIREWSFLDFTPNKLNGFSPSLVSSTMEGLSGNVEMNVLAFVRDAIDVYLSRGKDLGEFSVTYLNYVNYLKRNGIPILKYEDFCQNPEVIYNALSIEKHADQDIALADSERVTGDIQGLSRGNLNDKPIEIKRRYASISLRKKINSNMCIAYANKALGYPELYGGKKCEGLWEHLNFKVKMKKEKLMKNLNNSKR